MNTAADPENFIWLAAWIWGSVVAAVALIVCIAAVLWLQITAEHLKYLLGAATYVALWLAGRQQA